MANQGWRKSHKYVVAYFIHSW